MHFNNEHLIFFHHIFVVFHLANGRKLLFSCFSNFENGTHFTISVQSSERNVPLVSGTNMIFDIKNCSNNIECIQLDHNDILLTYFKSTAPF